MSGYEILKNRGVTRLCHFTKLQNLTHIISENHGILATDIIPHDTKHQSDKDRYDDETGYVCCSIEYPNSWFLDKVEKRDTDVIFTEWVVLYISLDILTERSAKYCPCNASRDCGAHVVSDISTIESIFQRSVPAFSYYRAQNMLAACPTNGQAEILIERNIPLSHIYGIAVNSEDIAKRVFAMLEMFSVKGISIYIAPDVLSSKWSDYVRNGNRPMEKKYVWEE